jgi:Plasmid encoded RepA protein
MAKNNQLTIDYRSLDKLPDWVKEVIETHLAIEAEDAKSAGCLGFMARALVLATMPYKDPKVDAFKRINGDFRLRIVAGYEGGIPYGIYPRLLMSWIATESVKTQSPIIELGDSLSDFLRDVIELRSGGGQRGSSTRVSEQMKRLFGSLITAEYVGGLANKGFLLKNILIADELRLDKDVDLLFDENRDKSLWMPQKKQEAGKWKSQVKLTDTFFQECIKNPVPIDLRAYKALRGSPMAMDLYTWLTYRMSYTERKSKPIRWESLMMQFGSNFKTDDMGQAVRDFKKGFLKSLQAVQVIYPEAKVEVSERGLVLLPSPTHIKPSPKILKSPQIDLFFNQ